MNRKDEFIKYIEFTKKHIPNSAFLLLQENKQREFFYIIHGSMVLLDIFINHCKLNGKSEEIENFLLGFRHNFNKLLLTVPLNDENIISYNLRVTVEILLKTIIFLSSEYSLQDTNNMTFREIEDFFNRENHSWSPEEKQQIGELKKIYGENSKILHIKDIQNIEYTEYLEEIITNKTDYMDRIINQIKHFKRSLENVLINLLEIDKNKFSSYERSNLQENLGEKWFKKFYGWETQNV